MFFRWLGGASRSELNSVSIAEIKARRSIVSLRVRYVSSRRRSGAIMRSSASGWRARGSKSKMDKWTRPTLACAWQGPSGAGGRVSGEQSYASHATCFWPSVILRESQEMIIESRTV